jgi:hypothetical protein
MHYIGLCIAVLALVPWKRFAMRSCSSDATLQLAWPFSCWHHQEHKNVLYSYQHS